MATVKAAKRRQEIIAVARELFMDRPYEDVSIGDLERATGLTRGPIYYYFESKEEIYATIVVDGLRMIERNIAEMAEQSADPAAFFAALIGMHETLYTTDKALFDIHFRFFFGRQNSVSFSEKHLGEVDDIIRSAVGTIALVIAKACSAGVFTCDDPHFAALAIWGMMVTILQMDCQNERFRSVGRSRETLAAGLVAQVLAMLSYDGAR